MKQGKTITQLAAELERMQKTSKDYIVPTQKLEMAPDASLAFANGEVHSFAPTEWAHSQIGQYADIPKAYYERILKEDPALLARNVNHGFSRQAETVRKDRKQESRMARTVDGKLRALVSSSYRRIDSYDMCNEVLPIMLDKGLQIDSAEITDKRVYIKALMPKLTAEVKKGDVVQYGLLISNSDVGCGSCRIEPLVYRLVCLNGLVMNSAIRKFHVGRNQAEDDIYELLSDNTRELTDAAFWSQVRDVTLNSMNEDYFQKQVERLTAAAEDKIENFDIPEVIELAARAVGINGEKTKQNMIAYLANGADGAGLTRWGLINAVTHAAQSEEISYDQSVDLERAGTQILELAPRDWKRIAHAAVGA
jgi:hypothetical protein